ncbi:methyl-accepting chemotaxis protein [Amorphus sp. MBR-141]
MPQQETKNRALKAPRKKSLRTRLALGVFVAVAIGFASTTVLTYVTEISRTAETLKQTHQQLTGLLAGQMSGAVRFAKIDAIEAATGQLGADEAAHADHFVTIGADGAIIAEVGIAQDAEAALTLARAALAGNAIINEARGAYEITAAPVRFGATNEAIGAVVVTWNNSAAWTMVRNRALISLGEALLIALIVALLIDVSMRRWMSRPIAEVVGTMNKLADGDTDVEIRGIDRRDEIGEMVRAVAVFRDNAIEHRRLADEKERDQRERAARQENTERLISLFRDEIQTVLGSISANMNQMQSTASELMGIAESATAGASGATAASQQASENVEAVASASEELAASIGEIGRQVSDTNSVVGRAANDTRTTNEKIAGLADAAQKIGEVVELISDIAAQTNLLALNATIEAARAGEHGRGFAIVAAEVKTLANQTAKATEEISAQIAAIQGSTEDAVSAIKSISDIMVEVSDCTAAIAAAVGQQGQATGDISRNVAEAAAGTRDAAARISGVTSVALQTSDAASQVETASNDVALQTADLRSVVDRFLQDVA